MNNIAWTAPRTWVASEIVTAALMNTHVRDNLLAIDAIFDIPTAPATGRVPVGDGTDFRTHAHAFVSAASLLLRHEVGGIEADISAITKGSLISASAAGTAALLAVGSDNTFLKADSGQSTGLTWASGVTVSNIVSATRTSASGNGSQAITGAGFAPTSAIVLASATSSEGGSIGFADDDGDQAVIHQDESPSPLSTNVSYVAYVAQSTGSPDLARADVTSMDADGMTLNWTSQGTWDFNVNLRILFLGG